MYIFLSPNEKTINFSPGELYSLGMRIDTSAKV